MLDIFSYQGNAIKTTVRYNCTLSKKLKLKKPKPPDVNKDVAQLEFHKQLLATSNEIVHTSNL